MDDPGEGTSSGTPVTADTRSKRSKTKKALPLVAPLRQAVGPTGEVVWVKVPFSTSDLNSWQEEVWNYKDPSKIAKRFELIVRNQDPDCADTESTLTQLTETEKELVIKTARAHVQGQIASGTLQGTVDQLFPIVNPLWDLNDAGNYAVLTRYRELLKFGLENSIPKAVNWSVTYNVKQAQHESPTDFVDRFQAAVRKYTTLDPSSDMGKQQLISLMLGQSSPDIRQKLQKLKVCKKTHGSINGRSMEGVQ